MVTNSNLDSIYNSFEINQYAAVEDINFITYKKPPATYLENDGSLDEWLERIYFIEEDMNSLLAMSHQKFWAQVIHNNSLHCCITSFLKLALRPHDYIEILNSDVISQKMESLYQIFFLVCVRMSSSKETATNQIANDVFANILYDNYIFDIPKIMDLCAIYGQSNKIIMEKMITNLFTKQPKYYDDLKNYVNTIPDLFNVLCQKCGFKNDIDDDLPKKLLSNGSQLLKTEEYIDIIKYISDLAHTIDIFLDIVPQVTQVFDLPKFCYELSNFYELLSSELPLILEKHTDIPINIYKVFDSSRLSLLNVFRKVLYNLTILKLFEMENEIIANEIIENFILVMSSILSEKIFLSDYNQLFPIQDDQDIINQSNYQIDDTRFNYIKDAILEAQSEYGSNRVNQNIYNNNRIDNQKINSKDSMLPNTSRDVLINENNLLSTIKKTKNREHFNAISSLSKISDYELITLISQVQELFPELGDGFIKLCLEEFLYNCEAVINALLENNLPLSLTDENRNLKLNDLEADVVEETTQSHSSLPLFSNNQVFSKKNNKLDYGIGKTKDSFSLGNHHNFKEITFGKQNPIESEEMIELNDKSTIMSKRHIYDIYANQYVESAYDMDKIDYDDEYDDTYDSHQIGDFDVESVDDLQNHFNKKINLLSRNNSDDESHNLRSNWDLNDKDKKKELNKSQKIISSNDNINFKNNFAYDDSLKNKNKFASERSQNITNQTDNIDKDKYGEASSLDDRNENNFKNNGVLDNKYIFPNNIAFKNDSKIITRDSDLKNKSKSDSSNYNNQKYSMQSNDTKKYPVNMPNLNAKDSGYNNYRTNEDSFASKNQRNFIQNRKDFSQSSNDRNEDHDGKDEENYRYKKNNNFLEDPAKLRELAEQRRQAKRNNQYRLPKQQPQQLQQQQKQQQHNQYDRDLNFDSNRTVNPNRINLIIDNNISEEEDCGVDSGSVNHQPMMTPRVYDVKGVAKGRGQANNVLKNRDYKEKHKSSAVHHNRKNLSERKHREF